MTQQEAIERALALRAEHGIDPSFATASAEKRIVEIGEGQPPDRLPEPGPRVDHIAWVVRLGSGPFAVELTLDDRTAELLRLRAPRGVTLAPARRVP